MDLKTESDQGVVVRQSLEYDKNGVPCMVIKRRKKLKKKKKVKPVAEPGPVKDTFPIVGTLVGHVQGMIQATGGEHFQKVSCTSYCIAHKRSY